MFLTVKEAIDFSEKSQTTIHRLCQKFDGTKGVWKENNKYLIDKDLLIEQYPELVEKLANETAGDISDDASKKIIADNNLKITGLTIENEDLKQKLSETEKEFTVLKEKAGETKSPESKNDDKKHLEKKDKEIKKLNDKLLECHHELAEMTDAVMNLQKELSAVNRFNEISSTPIPENPEVKLAIQKKMVKYQLTGITISVMVLIAFLFGMYMMTK